MQGMEGTQINKIQQIHTCFLHKISKNKHFNGKIICPTEPLEGTFVALP